MEWNLRSYKDDHAVCAYPSEVAGQASRVRKRHLNKTPTVLGSPYVRSMMTRRVLRNRAESSCEALANERRSA